MISVLRALCLISCVLLSEVHGQTTRTPIARLSVPSLPMTFASTSCAKEVSNRTLGQCQARRMADGSGEAAHT